MQPPRVPATRALRRALRAARRRLSPQMQRDHARQLARRLGRHPVFLRARHVGVYWSADGELDLAPLRGLAQSRCKRWYLPVLRPHLAGRLWMVAHAPGMPLRRNVFGIPEPRWRRIRPPFGLDLLLVPLVGFDADCNRLGMGAGYYDRTLAYLRHRRHFRRPRLAGIAHECQRVDGLPVEPWDVPLDLVATEARIYIRGQRS